MVLIVLLTLAAVVCGMFDITFPKGIKLNYTAQQYNFNCEYDPDAEVFPWNQYGSPLGLKQYIDKSMLQVYFCTGSDWRNYSNWDDCEEIKQYIQPYAGDVCITNLTSDEYFEPLEMGTNGTIRIFYQENGDGSSLQCIPITISPEGPEFDEDSCKNDDNTGFQEYDHGYDLIYGPTIWNLLVDEGYGRSLSLEYITYTVHNGKTSALYNYWITSRGGSSLVDTKTVTPTETLDLYYVTFTHDGTRLRLNGVTTDLDWTDTDTNTYTEYSSTRRSSSRTSRSDSESVTLTARTTRRLSSAEAGGDSETASETGSATGSETVTAASNTPDSSSTSETGSSSSSSTSTDLGTVFGLSGLMIFAVVALGLFW